MKHKNKHINEEDLQRYLDGQMTPVERNLFERELQKDPFMAEAMEGFEGISTVNIQNDLKELKGKITHKKRKNRYHYWAAAASILLVVTAGIIWIELKDQNSVQEMAENKEVQKQEEKIVTPEMQKEIIPESKIIQPQATGKSVEEIGGTQKDATISAQKKSASVPPNENTEDEAEIVVFEMADAEMEIAESLIEIKQEIAAPRAYSHPNDSDKKLITEDVKTEVETKSSTVLFRIVQEEEIISDSFAEIQSHDKQMVAPTTKSTEKNSLEKLPDLKVHPINGMAEFEKYLNREAVLPNTYNRNKKTLKLTLKINSTGEITGIENKNSADSLIFEKAKKIINDGPEWAPEINNGIRVESEIEIKIVFRKEN